MDSEILEIGKSILSIFYSRVGTRRKYIFPFSTKRITVKSGKDDPYP